MEAKTHTHTHTHTVTLQYLGRVVLKEDNDTPAVHHNIKKAQQTWDQFQKVLEKGEMSPHLAGRYVLPSGGSFDLALRQQELGGVPVGDA